MINENGRKVYFITWIAHIQYFLTLSRIGLGIRINAIVTDIVRNICLHIHVARLKNYGVYVTDIYCNENYCIDFTILNSFLTPRHKLTPEKVGNILCKNNKERAEKVFKSQ